MTSRATVGAVAPYREFYATGPPFTALAASVGDPATITCRSPGRCAGQLRPQALVLAVVRTSSATWRLSGRATTSRSRARTRSFYGFGRGLGDPSVIARNPSWQEAPTMQPAPATVA